jgi:hypothetical protein
MSDNLMRAPDKIIAGPDWRVLPEPERELKE